METKKYTKKVVVSGYYGMSNYGDDLFGILTYLYYRNFYDIVKVSAPPINTNIKIDYVNIPFVTGSLSKINYAGQISRFFQNGIASLWCDEYILAGGSNLSYNSSYRQRSIPVICKKYFKNIKINGLGLSLGPFNSENETKKYHKLVRNFDYLLVRDNASYREASKNFTDCNIELSFDLAVLGIDKLTNKITKKEGVGISLCHGISYDEIKLIADKIISSDLGAKIFVLNYHESIGDKEMSEKLAVYFKSQGYLKFEIISAGEHTVEDIWNQIGSCEIFFSVRLHGAITAYCHNVPFILYEYQKKCKDYLETVGQEKDLIISSVGLDKALDNLLSNARIPSVSPCDLLNKFDNKLKNSIRAVNEN